jgi:uncharacterized protein (UPF0332 family)
MCCELARLRHMERDAELYLAKAAESLDSAESDYVHGRYNSCANRSYYACFQAAVAALIQEGILPYGDWGHDFVHGRFVGQLIDRRKRFLSDLRRTLPDNQKIRDQADYRSDRVSETQAIRSLRRARAFVDAVQQRSRP